VKRLWSRFTFHVSRAITGKPEDPGKISLGHSPFSVAGQIEISPIGDVKWGSFPMIHGIAPLQIGADKEAAG
jgi:hypothetical protein